jgi:Na+/H+ antiporter NhaD/arsenite permease-like protein
VGAFVNTEAVREGPVLFPDASSLQGWISQEDRRDCTALSVQSRRSFFIDRFCTGRRPLCIGWENPAERRLEAMKIFVLVVALAMYALVIAFTNKKSWIALGAAALLLVFGAVDVRTAVFELVNWNILLIYIGSLVIADLFIYSRVPAVLADKVVAKSPTLGIAIVIILVLTGLISAFVENVATVLLMAPIALEICRRLKLNPAPFMIGLAVMANLQGTATLVGDPPSMIFASFAGYGFNDFFFYQDKMSIFFAVQVGMIVGALFFYGYFRKLRKESLDLPTEKIVSWIPTVLLLGMIFGLATISFVSGKGLHYTSGLLCMVLALIGLGWFLFVRKESAAKTGELVKRLDWDTILFLVGIFIVVGAISKVGLLDDLAAILGGVINGNALLGFIVIVVVSVLVSGFVDNVPYIIAMLPVAATLARSLNLAPELFMFGLLIGSCLGGNLTPFGASANVVAMGLVKKEGYKVNFMEWLKIGGPFTILTTFASALFVWFVWG